MLVPILTMRCWFVYIVSVSICWWIVGNRFYVFCKNRCLIFTRWSHFFVDSFILCLRICLGISLTRFAPFKFDFGCFRQHCCPMSNGYCPFVDQCVWSPESHGIHASPPSLERCHSDLYIAHTYIYIYVCYDVIKHNIDIHIHISKDIHIYQFFLETSSGNASWFVLSLLTSTWNHARRRASMRGRR